MVVGAIRRTPSLLVPPEGLTPIGGHGCKPINKQRAAMLGSYGSRAGVLQALSVLAGSGLSPELRERVIEDTLRGAPGAKQAWTESGMVQDVSAGLDAVTVPVTVVIGDRDRVEHERALREVFGRFLPHAVFRVLNGVGHLSPLEAPDAVAEVCSAFLDRL